MSSPKTKRPSQKRLSTASISSPAKLSSPHHKNSLRRLSSLANLQLNPFNRRRSSHTSLSSTDESHAQTKQGRRQSYMALPENLPPCSLPKSRTFSNLPLRKSRLSTGAPAATPRSRIPTPTAGTNARARFASATKVLRASVGRPGKGLTRSDTEPLLLNTRSPSTLSISSRACKENLALSPLKPVSRLDIPIPMLCTTTPTHRRSTVLRHSPPLTPISARHATQPLQSVTSRPSRLSYGGDIRRHSLLAPVAAPVLPPTSRPRPSRLSTSLRPATDTVTSAETTAYWSGRLSALLDRQRNAHLAATMSKGETLSCADVDVQNCLEKLQDKCGSDTARGSLAVFKRRVRKVKGIGVYGGDEDDIDETENKIIEKDAEGGKEEVKGDGDPVVVEKKVERKDSLA